jgi:hypothetical protein
MIFLVSSPVAALGGAKLEEAWLTGLAVLLFFLSFWHEHRDRFTGGRLGYAWPTLLGVVGCPDVIRDAICQAYAPMLSKSLQAGLRFFAVPYTVYPSALVFAEDRLYWDQVMLSVLSGMLFVTLVGHYSAWFRRHSVQSLINVALALFGCALFQIGFYLTEAVLRHRGEIEVRGPAVAYGMLAGWLVIAAVVFVSLERLVLGLLYPIANAFLPLQANPFVYLWNKLTQAESSRFSRTRPDAEQSGAFISEWVRGVATAAAMLLIACSAAVQGLAFFQPPRRTVDSQFASSLADSAVAQAMQHRHFSQLRTGPQGGLQADIYSRLSPLLAEEVAVLSKRIDAAEATSLAAARGWQTGSAVQLDALADSRSASAANDKAPVTVLKTVYVQADGRITTEPPTDQSVLSGVATVQLIAQFPLHPSPKELENLKDQFAELLGGRLPF